MEFTGIHGTPMSFPCACVSPRVILWHSIFFMVQLSYSYMTTGKTIALTRWTFVGKVMSQLIITLSQFSLFQLLSCVRIFTTPWTTSCQASLSITNSWSLLILMSIKLVMPSNHLILGCPLLLLPSIFPSIRVFVKAFFPKEKVSFNFLAAVSIHSDFGAQENKICHCFLFFPFYMP